MTQTEKFVGTLEDANVPTDPNKAGSALVRLTDGELIQAWLYRPVLDRIEASGKSKSILVEAYPVSKDRVIRDFGIVGLPDDLPGTAPL